MRYEGGGKRVVGLRALDGDDREGIMLYEKEEDARSGESRRKRRE